MSKHERKNKNSPQGVVLVVAMIFMVVFSSLGVAMLRMSSTNIRVADNHHKANTAMDAALSGLECGQYFIANYSPVSNTTDNLITTQEADAAWNQFSYQIQQIGGQSATTGRLTNDVGTETGDFIEATNVNLGGIGASFNIKFSRLDTDPFTIILESTGTYGQLSRRVRMSVAIAKDTRTLEYAVASKSRIIVTGDSTIEGDIYSTYDRPNYAPPFELRAESTVNGTLNTVVEKGYFNPQSTDYVGYTLETLDENGNPMFDENGNRVYSEGDMVQGTHQGINYGQPLPTLPGFEASDYDTSSYGNNPNMSYFALSDTTDGVDGRVTEYFPHADNDFTQPLNGSSKQIHRYVIENQTITNRTLRAGSNALFRNCTFEGVLFVESTTENPYYPNYADSRTGNNVRFENCNFNGTIVTEVPEDFQWKNNMLYFTNDAIFNNTYMEEATILAPNFNVNVGNARALEDGSESVLEGLVVGGIVDIRGNASVEGTILSMYDPSELGYASRQYGTNVGFSDENNEASVPGDAEFGTIHVRPDPDRMLPVGVASDIILVVDQTSYQEL
ncbi:MAG TPA: hypothetical protein HPP87_00255 [Planctomycetes bacterium]|nr:hypothetical protein [Planctomycetota bacterium]